MGPKKMVLILALIMVTATIGFATVIWRGKISDSLGADRGPDQPRGFREIAEGFAQQKGAKDAGEPVDPEEAVIDRLIEILKNKNAPEEQRSLAAVGLGKLGSKAKRAAADVNKYVDERLRISSNGSELQTLLWAAARVGTNNKETFDILARACAWKDKVGADKTDELTQFGAIEGLRQFGSASEKAFRDKAIIELQVLAETGVTLQVRNAALKAVHDINDAVTATRTNNLKHIALAVHNYHNNFGTFPPAAICDKNGKPLLSWRVAILPFIEQQDLYSEFKLTEPWDSEHNKKLSPRMPQVYAVSLFEPNAGTGKTAYQVFVGTERCLSGPHAQVSIRDFPDGTSNTILLAESATPMSWTKPADMEVPDV